MALAEHRPRSRRRRLLGRAIVAATVLGVGGAAYLGVRGTVNNFGGPSCQARAMNTAVEFSPEQMANAATITAIAMKRGLPARAATIALATAIQESKLRNITYGDRDSLGLFQQRPSQGWGTEQQIMDPEYSTNKFYDALVKIKGYQTMEITVVAQEVQRSAAPEAYADHETEGRVLASTLAGHNPGEVACRLDPAAGAADATGIRAQLRAELAVEGRPSGTTIVVTAADAREAWSVGSWAVAKADATGIRAVSVGTRRWERTRDKAGWSWQSGGTGRTGTTVVISLT